MKVLLTGTATVVAAIALGALLAPEAGAKDYCRCDVTGHVVSCSFDTMQQCQAARFGLGGDCYRDPWHGNQSGAGAANAMAYYPGNAYPYTPASAGAFASAGYPGSTDAYAYAGPVAHHTGRVYAHHTGRASALAYYQPRLGRSRHRGRAYAVRVPRHGGAYAYYRPRSEQLRHRARQAHPDIG